jgi:Rod binding domain-containing protein
MRSSILLSLLIFSFLKFEALRAETMNIQQTPIELQRRQNPDPEVQKKQLEKKMHEVADLYEKQFLGEMVKAMRSTVSYSAYSQPSMAEQIYRDKMYEEYVQNWSKKGGVGFSKIIYQQLLERYSPYHRRINDTPTGPRPLKSNEILGLNEKDKDFKKINE